MICLELSRSEVAMLIEAALHAVPRYGADAVTLSEKLQHASKCEAEPAPCAPAPTAGREAVRIASERARRETAQLNAERARKRAIEKRREAERAKIAARAAECRRAA